MNEEAKQQFRYAPISTFIFLIITYIFMAIAVIEFIAWSLVLWIPKKIHKVYFGY